MGKLVKIYGRERTQGLYIKIYNMILIRKVRNPTLIRNLYSSLFLWQKPYTYSTSPSDMPIDKILKAVSRKKYNTTQDVMFCAMIFDLLTRNTSSPGIEHTDMTSEVHKMIFGSLQYITQLTFAETLVFANNCLGLLIVKKIKIDKQVVADLVQKINHKIGLGLDKDFEGKHVYEITEYVKKLVLLKNVDFPDDIIHYLVMKPKKEAEVIQIINAFCSMKSKTKLTFQKAIHKLLENQIGSKIDSLPLESKLIDESVLKIFFEFNFQIKQPYNCIPQWLFVFSQKLREKYASPSYHISALKKISFFRFYRKMLTSTILISQCYYTSEMLKFLPEYFRKICQLFDYSDEEPMEEKVSKFLYCIQPYLGFFQLYPMYETEEAITDVCEFMKKIFQRYLTQVRYWELSPQQQIRFSQLMAFYSLIINELLIRYKDNRTLNSVLPKVHHKLIQIYKFSFSKNQAIFQNFYQFAPLLPIIAKFSRHPAISYLDKGEAISLLNGFGMVIENIGKTKILEFYQNISKVDFISICFFTSKYLNVEMGQKFESIVEEIKKTSLITVIETAVNCLLIREQVLKKQLMNLSDILKQRFLTQNQNSCLRKSLTGFKFKNHEEELVGDLIFLLKVEFKGMELDANLYRYWFIQNKDITKRLFDQSNPVLFQKCWAILRSALRYLNFLTQDSGIDILSEITRFNQGQLEQDFRQKYSALFNDRRIYQILFIKTDLFAKLKYSWNMGFLVDCIVNLARKKDYEEFGESQKNRTSKKQQEELSGEKLSFFKLIELLSFCALDLREPLQFSTYRSRSTCKLLNESLSKIIAVVESSKRSQKSQLEKSKQQLICSLPMEQIIYFLNEHNSLPEKSWVRRLQPQYLLSFMADKYSKIAQYNIFLSFDPTQEGNKKIHNDFILQEISETQPEIMQSNNKDIFKQRLKSSILKYYFYFLQPDKSQNSLVECVRLIGNLEVLSDEEVLKYWVSKQIVMRTTHDELIEAILERLMGLNTEITYAQFKTVLNTIFTLWKKARLQNYQNFDQRKKKALAKWVDIKFREFAEIRFESFLDDYLVLVRYFPSLSALNRRVQTAISQNLRRNNISTLEQIYQGRQRLSEQNVMQLKKLLIRAKFRCLTQNYFNQLSNVEFRVEFIFKIVWGTALMQNSQLAEWVWDNFLKFVDVSHMRQILHSLIIRYRVSPHKTTVSDVQSLLQSLAEQFQYQMQGKLTQVQEKRSENLNKQSYALTSIGGSQVKLYEYKSYGGKFIYLTQNEKPNPEQQFQAMYIRSLQRVDLEFRSIG